MPRALAALAVSLVSLAGCLAQSVDHLNGFPPGDETGGSGSGDTSTSAGPGTSGATSGAGAGTSGAATSGATTGGGGAPQKATYTVAVDSGDADLMDATDVTITVDPMGFVGPVTLVADTEPGIDVAIADSTIDLDGGAPVTTTLTLTTHSDVEAGDVPFTVTAASAPGTHEASGTLTIHQRITIHIPQGVNGMGQTLQNPYKKAYGPFPIVISGANVSGATPLVVKVRNDDDVPHQIHADGAEFPHDTGDIPAHQTDPLVRALTGSGQYDWYLHDQNAAITPGRIVIQ